MRYQPVHLTRQVPPHFWQDRFAVTSVAVVVALALLVSVVLGAML